MQPKRFESTPEFAHFKAVMRRVLAVPKAELDALARTVVISGDETTLCKRVQELLASGLDELLLQPLPITDEARERKALLHLVGSL